MSDENTQEIEQPIPMKENGDENIVDFGSIIDEAAKKSGLDLNKLNEEGDGLATSEDIHSGTEFEKPKDDSGEQSEQAPNSEENSEEKKAADPVEKKEEVKADDNKAEKKEESKQVETKEEGARDADLEKAESQLDPHTKPKTKQHIALLKTAAIKARDELDSIRSERDTIRKELDAIKAAPKAIPEEVEKELAALRDQVRTFDATKDPSIINKYDKKIEGNIGQITSILESQGLPKATIESLKKQGITLSSIKKYIDTIDTGIGLDGKKYDPDPDTAEALREAIRENGRLAKERENEINSFKASYEERTKKEAEEQKKLEQDAVQRRDKELTEYVDRFDFLKKPADIGANDAPGIRKEKERLINLHNERILRFSEGTKKALSDPITANITAQKGVLAMEVIVPELQAKIEALTKELSEAKSKTEKMKAAGSVSKTVVAAPKQEEEKEEPYDMNASFDDIIERAARKAGVK